MRQDPYRRPVAPPAEKPRGVVVRRADEPEALDAAEERRRAARFRAQSILAQAELEEAQRSMDRAARLAGLAMIALGLVMSALIVSSLRDGYYHPRTVALTPAFLFTGAWSLAVGAGRGATMDSVPPWVKIGAVTTFVLGLAWGSSGYLDLLALFAG